MVKIRHDDVILRHVTWFLKFQLKKCWRQQKVGTKGPSVLIYRMRANNTFSTRGQPLSYDKRLNNYRIFSFCRIFDDFRWRHHEKCRCRENYDVIHRFFPSKIKLGHWPNLLPSFRVGVFLVPKISGGVIFAPHHSLRYPKIGHS